MEIHAATVDAGNRENDVRRVTTTGFTLVGSRVVIGDDHKSGLSRRHP